MLESNIRILDFDASVIKQQNLLNKFKHEIINLQDLGPKTRLWMNRQTKNAVLGRIKQLGGGCISFLGSGDFHHISSLLLSQFQEPVSLIVFDFHPDWDILPPRTACGAWVTQALKRENLQKCFLIGVSSSDISWPGIQTGNLSALESDKLEIYPYIHSPSTVFFRKVPENISLRLMRGFFQTIIYWEELKNKNPEDFLRSLLKRIPTQKVYVSIDKDCLKNEFSLTNWEEGMLLLNDLISMLKLIKENLDIVGLDICGDYSRISVSGRLKAFFSRLDHPKDVQAEGASEGSITGVNEFTNIKILEALL